MATNATNNDTDDVTNDYETAASTRRNTAPLLARRRQRLDRDGHIESERYDFRREGDGHKIRRVVIENQETGDDVTESDLTALEGAAPSTTSSIRLIEFEAEIAADDKTRIENPHIPTNDNVLRAALDHLRPMDLTPAWEVVDGE